MNALNKRDKNLSVLACSPEAICRGLSLNEMN